MPIRTASPAYGFAIVGSGMIAEFHAQALTHVAGGRLVGVASRNLASATRLAEKHGVTFVTPSITELVARADVDVVCIATPSGNHLEPALVAIRAGKHVIVEKPLEITTERIDELLHTADAAGVYVAPIFQARFGQGALRVKAALDEGRFGRLVLASAYVKWHRSAEYYRGWKGTIALDGGGALMNQAIHAVDLLQWFAGMPAEVFCFTTRRIHAGIESEDTASATLRFAGGALGAIEASTALYPGWRRRLEITGEHGSVVLEDDDIVRWDFRETKGEDDRINSTNDKVAFGSGARRPDAINFAGHQQQIQNLIDALRYGHVLAVDGWEARKAVAIIRGLYASAGSNARVAIS